VKRGRIALVKEILALWITLLDDAGFAIFEIIPNENIIVKNMFSINMLAIFCMFFEDDFS
jgi:hypothetical protein